MLGIPTAKYQNFCDYNAARRYLDSVPYNVVLKATGLAAGKGVIIPLSKEDADDALRRIMLQKDFGSAGDEVVIEEFLEGEELSFLTFSDGYSPYSDCGQLSKSDLSAATQSSHCRQHKTISKYLTVLTIRAVTLLMSDVSSSR